MTTAAPAPVPVDDDTLRQVAAGLFHDPHAVLGAHTGTGGVTVRVLRPMADRVAIVTADGETEATHELDGIWVAVLDVPEVTSYRVAVTYGADTTVSDDPYRFLPTIGELDQHLLREGRHEQLWTALGANVHRYPDPLGDVVGTAVAVWAPTTRSVRVIGDFAYW